MRTRASQTVVPLLIIAAVLATTGCNVLKKLGKKKPPADDDGTVGSTFNDIDAVNKAQVARFPDERRLFLESGFVRQLSLARTEPSGGGTIVAVIDADTLVTKHAARFGNTLITFNRAAFPGSRFAGWVPDSAFLFPIAAPPPPSTNCTMTLRQSGFVPSKSTCSFNENVRSGSPATLNFPCGGGVGTARFGSQIFVGTASRDRVAMSHTSTIPFSGCQIRTVQTITGTPPNLSYFLSESIVGGTCRGVSTCTARSSISAN
jgi:hypothetical protein